MTLRSWKTLMLLCLLCATLGGLAACGRGRQPTAPPATPLPPSPTSQTLATDATTALDTSDTATTAARLALVETPARDLRELALRLRPELTAVPLVVNATAPDYAVGDRIPFRIENADTLQAYEITAELIHKTAVAYAWVEVGPTYSRESIVAAVDRFSDQTYPAAVAFFGSEWKPGVDNDPRLHVLHATNLGSVAGYFSSANQVSRLVNPFSNEKEIFFISLGMVNDRGAYDDVLAHEFQHMIHWHHDSNEATWVDEGLSEYAKEVAGLPARTGFVSQFSGQPDTQLTAWGQGTGNHYGAAYLFMKYLHQRFGPTFLSTLVDEEADDVAGIQAALARTDGAPSFDDLFADWVVANYANQPRALAETGRYGYIDFAFRRPDATALDHASPRTPYQATVNNYAADYLQLPAQDAPYTLHFAGQTTTSLAAFPAYSGRYSWWSQHRDKSDTRLTRRFDLRPLSAGSLVSMTVAMAWDIETHYDYGYVVASRDGQKWEILSGDQTTTENPTGNSFGPAYTGASTGGWIQQHFDLSAYAGQEVWVRFEYVTDDAITAPGWFIDDIRIPALDYATDFEQGADGWESEGWLWSDNQLAQGWLVQVLVFEEDALVEVRRLAVDATGQAQVEIDASDSQRQVVLAISALAPITTFVAGYEIILRAPGD